MTQGSAEEESNKRRSLRWRNRLSRSARQQDQQDQQLQRPEPSALNGSTSDNTSTSVVGGSDNVSMHSNGHPGDDLGDNSTMTKSQQVRNKELPILFKQVPPNDMLLRDFNCALQKDVLLQGRLFITQSFVGFKSNILGYVTTVEFKIEDIKHIDRVRVLRWMPRVLQITMKNDDKYTFTSFLSSLSSARDEAYYCLVDLWQQTHPQTRPPSVLSSSSGSSSVSLASKTSTTPSPPHQAPSTTDSVDNTNENLSLPSKGNSVSSPSSTAPSSSHFKIFQRRRAQTVSSPNDSPSRERSATSSSTPLSKNANGHISWIDNEHHDTQPVEFRPLSSPPPMSLSPVSSILKTTKRPSTTDHAPPPSSTHDAPTTHHLHVKTLLTIGGILLFLSHAFLTYEFYHVTQLFTLQQQPPSHDTAWISGQLQDVKNQAQLWEMETQRQRRQLLDLIPS